MLSAGKQRTSKDSVSSKAKQRWADPEFRAAMQAKLTAFWADKANREKMQAAAVAGWKGREDRREAVSSRMQVLRRGVALTDAHKKAIGDGVRRSGYRHSTESREKISLANKDRPISLEQRKQLSAAQTIIQAAKAPEYAARRAAVAKAREALWHVCACHEGCKAVVKSAKVIYARGHNPASRHKLNGLHRYLYARGRVAIRMRSSWEVLYAEYLDAHKIAWQYEAKTFAFNWMHYTPDFYLPGTDEYVEVKGHFSRANKKKVSLFRKAFSNVKLRIVGSADMVEIFDFFGLQDKQH